MTTREKINELRTASINFLISRMLYHRQRKELNGCSVLYGGIYYRDKVDYTTMNPLKGRIEINFPCFWVFDPTHPDNSDIRRWTQVLATITNSTKELEAIREMFDQFTKERHEISKKNTELAKTYKEKAFTITLPILNDILDL